MPKSTLAENYRYKKTVPKGTLINGQALLLDSYVVKKFLRSVQHEGTQITPRGWLFWTMIFYNLIKLTLRSI